MEGSSNIERDNNDFFKPWERKMKWILI